jgi:hypothetical protein
MRSSVNVFYVNGKFEMQKETSLHAGDRMLEIESQRLPVIRASVKYFRRLYVFRDTLNCLVG